MRLERRAKIQLAIFAVIALVAGAVMVFGYLQAPALVGVGRYTVTVELPRGGGLYPNGNVTYRGVEVGRVSSVSLTDTGAQAVMSLRTDQEIPSDVNAQVRSVSAVGEQYIALIPRGSGSAPLRDGDVIPRERTWLRPELDRILNATNSGLQAIPRDDLKTVIDESYIAFGGLGPELTRIIKGANALGQGAADNLDALTALVDNSAPVLNSQVDSGEAISAWARQVASVTDQLKTNDEAVAGLLTRGPGAADEARALIDRISPTLPVLLANLTTVGQVAVTYDNNIEQVLVLVPAGVAASQAVVVPNADIPGPARGVPWTTIAPMVQFNLPPPCTTGFLPAAQRRTPDQLDFPDRPPGDLYCRIPQDSPFNVRGARNIPCETKPGKRAPTVAMCESDEEYVPLNDGFNWKGDVNATWTGQGVPQVFGEPPPPGAAPAPAQTPPIPVAGYDPATGVYIAPDGRLTTQSDLAATGPATSWQSMLLPPGAK